GAVGWTHPRPRRGRPPGLPSGDAGHPRGGGGDRAGRGGDGRRGGGGPRAGAASRRDPDGPQHAGRDRHRGHAPRPRGEPRRSRPDANDVRGRQV
ncbi:MAG: Regulatory protein, LuxR:Response regulator receiver, partial [uncultured Rubrobacteraceae bacterium]